MNNLKEFKELIEKYNSITIEDLNEKFALDYISSIYSFPGSLILNEITGFGSPSTCSLCQVLNVSSTREKKCLNCIWFLSTNSSCCDDINKDTYLSIINAEAADELLEAIKYRAEYMQEVLDEYLKKEDLNEPTK